MVLAAFPAEQFLIFVCKVQLYASLIISSKEFSSFIFFSCQFIWFIELHLQGHFNLNTEFTETYSFFCYIFFFGVVCKVSTIIFLLSHFLQDPYMIPIYFSWEVSFLLFINLILGKLMWLVLIFRNHPFFKKINTRYSHISMR